jgi:hypothetical protein
MAAFVVALVDGALLTVTLVALSAVADALVDQA